MKISIITVTYNSAATIAACVDSVYQQTHPDIEHIVVDGLSKDATVSIVESMPNRVQRLISEKDKGIYDAMNKGIACATGDLIGTLNSDDVYYDNQVLEKVARVFEDYPEVDCLYGNLLFVDNQGKVVRKWHSKAFSPGLFSKSWSPAHPTFYCRKKVYDTFGLYKTDYKIAADVEWMLRVLELGKTPSYFHNEMMVKMNLGGVSTSGIQSTLLITKEMKRAFAENNMTLNLPKYLFYKGLKLKEFF